MYSPASHMSCSQTIDRTIVEQHNKTRVNPSFLIWTLFYCFSLCYQRHAITLYSSCTRDGSSSNLVELIRMMFSGSSHLPFSLSIWLSENSKINICQTICNEWDKRTAHSTRRNGLVTAFIWQCKLRIVLPRCCCCFFLLLRISACMHSTLVAMVTRQ